MNNNVPTKKLVTGSDVKRSLEEAKYYVTNRERITAENAAKANKKVPRRIT